MVKGVFVGLSTIDVVCRVEAFPESNEKITAQSQDVFAGGPATNAAIAFSFLGGTATLVTAVGRHPIGRVIRDELETHSIRLIDLNPEFAKTPAISSVAVNRQGERSVVSANAGRIGARLTAVNNKALEDAAVVLVDGHQMKACQAWGRAARERRISVVLDGGSWKNGTEELLKSVDVAICSADFLPPGCATEEEVLCYLRDCGVRRVAISHGAEPLRYVSDGREDVIAVPRVGAVDTMGAGDILHGAYCFKAAGGSSFEEALSGAVRFASESCRYRGTREWMRHVGSRDPTHPQ